jgi:hypothetical protein
MAGLTNGATDNILSWMKGTTWPTTAVGTSPGWGAAPATTYVGLFTTNPTSDVSTANGSTEVSGGSYARVGVTSSSGWSAISTGSGTIRQISNSGVITFATPTVSWGTVIGVGIFDSLTTGQLLWWNSITSQVIGIGVVASFAVSALVLTMD